MQQKWGRAGGHEVVLGCIIVVPTDPQEERRKLDVSRERLIDGIVDARNPLRMPRKAKLWVPRTGCPCGSSERVQGKERKKFTHDKVDDPRGKIGAEGYDDGPFDQLLSARHDRPLVMCAVRQGVCSAVARARNVGAWLVCFSVSRLPCPLQEVMHINLLDLVRRMSAGLK